MSDFCLSDFILKNRAHDLREPQDFKKKKQNKIGLNFPCTWYICMYICIYQVLLFYPSLIILSYQCSIKSSYF